MLLNHINKSIQVSLVGEVFDLLHDKNKTPPKRLVKHKLTH